MAERRKSKGLKWNEGEEGTDGSKQKGGGGGKEQHRKRSGLAGASHYIHKRVTGQPKWTPKKGEGKSDLPSFDQKQQAPVAVISPVPSEETLSSTEGATPPTAHDTRVSDSQSVSTIKDFGAPNEFGCNQAMSGLGPMNNQVIKSAAHVDHGASGTQLDPPLIIESESECKEDSLIIQGSKEENETKGNDYDQRIGQLTKSLSKKEEEVIKLKVDLNANKMLIKERLKVKDRAYNEQEAIKLQLERELAIAKVEVTLLNERLNSSMEEELKEKISELEKEMNEKFEYLQWKDARIKHLEEQLSEKEKSVFNAEGSDAADKRERELMIKQVEDLKKESERNIAEATRRIEEVEETYREQLKEIYKLREENTVLKAGTVEEQGNMRERLTELEALYDKVAASHEEEMNHIRRKEEAKRVELEEKWKRKFDEESQQRTQSHLQKMNEAIEAVKKKYRDRLQAREKELQAQLDRFSQENKELKEHLYNREEAYSVLQDSLDRKSVITMELEEQVENIVKHSAEKDQKIKEISERLALKETENELFKQDFESERKDREIIKGQLINLQEEHKILKQESAEKEKEAQMKFHNLKQSNHTLEHDLEKSRKEIATKGAEIESLVQKNAQLEKQHTEELRKIKKKLKELEMGETDRVKEMEEEMRVLTAQVNAYSREVDKQKGLVTQSQEKHKTEIIELNERLSNELESKKQLDIELDRMRQQLDNVSADKEIELLRAYHQEKAKLKDQIEKMKQANKVLMEKIVASNQQLSAKQEEVISLQKILSGFQNTWELSHREVSLLEELGRGGYGVVWVGQLKVAVKKLHERIVSQHNMETFHHEINIMSQLRHPNLLQFIGAVLDDPSGCPMIVTEVMDTSLREAYENKELTPDPGCRPVILSVLHDAAVGLNYLHCLPDPIIHRDVSSANVLLQSIAGTRKWKGKISDFGSAKLAKKAITEGPGAFAYSAPEAFQSIASQDPTKKQTTKMDVFSYGVLLCEIITCRFPNRVNFQDMLRQVHSISNRPSGTRYTQGSLLHSLIVSCCHDDPSRRPTMKEIIEQLDIISK